MHAYLQALLDTMTQHPGLAIALAFLISAGEALLVIGLFVPSTIVLVGIGGIIGMGKLPLLPIFLASTAGAAAGDALSYWIGHHYRERLYGMWPFSRYQHLLDKGQDYFAKHGGKSVVIGRFVPGIKSVVPGIAGMMGMNPVRFTVLNILSAFGWAAVHLLPGMSAGWVLLVLAGISKRLAFTLALLVLFVLLLVWLLNQPIRLGQQQWPVWQQRLARQIPDQSSTPDSLLGKLVLPQHADLRQRSGLYLIIGLLGVVLGSVLLNEIFHRTLGGFDPALSQSLQGLRTAWTDPPMLAATLSGDAKVIAGVVCALSGVLLWQRRYRLLAGVAACFVLAAGFIFGLKDLLQIPRPLADLYAGVDAFSFPSGHAGFSTVLAGLLIWFIAKSWRGRPRSVAMTVLIFLVVLISFSRIYLGAHWPSDILGSLLFGSLLVMLFALLFRHETVPAWLTRWLVTVSAVAYLGLAGWHINTDWQAAVLKYKVQPNPPIVLTQPWRQHGWQQLPTYRQDLTGQQEEPFVLQWRGSLESLQRDLPEWRATQGFSLSSLNGIVAANTPPEQLPVLAKLHAGHAQALSLQADGINGRFVLRLYPQQVTDSGQQHGRTIWLGTITHEYLYHPLGQFSIVMSDDEQVCTAPLFKQLPNLIITGKSLPGGPEYSGCGGEIVLGWDKNAE